MGRQGLILTVRRATAPGVLYPADDRELGTTVDRLLQRTAPHRPLLADGLPCGAIVPDHAYERSGMTAAAAYSHLRPWRHSVRRVVALAGSPDRSPGLTLTDVAAFETPLGTVELDQDACRELASAPFTVVDHDAHEATPAVEVQIPFLQRTLAPGWRLVPALCGPGHPSNLADVLEPLWLDPSTLFVVSSTLSQGRDDRTARFVDRRTSAAIVSRWWEAVGDTDVSASSGVRSLLELARRHGRRVDEVRLDTSADSGGSLDQVSGYGSFLVR